MTLARDEAGGLAAASARVWVFTVLPKQRIVQSLACFVSGGTRSAVTGQGSPEVGSSVKCRLAYCAVIEIQLLELLPPIAIVHDCR